MRRAAEYRLAQLQALDDIDGARRRGSPTLARRLGRAPASWAEVVARRGPAAACRPIPSGVPYGLDRDGRVTLGAGSELAPLPALETHR